MIATLLVAALLLLFVPDKPVRMGLDLAGGTRLVYVNLFRKAGQSIRMAAPLQMQLPELPGTYCRWQLTKGMQFQR